MKKIKMRLKSCKRGWGVGERKSGEIKMDKEIMSNEWRKPEEAYPGV